MTRKDRKLPWLLTWRQRSLRTRKMKRTEEEILTAKKEGNWTKAIKLKHLLRKVWWGYKRIKNK